DKKLYVPLDGAHLVSRYIGGRKGMPKLTKLGGVSWKNAKFKAEDSASDFAADMLRMQAMRHHAKGHRTAPDNQWQQMFEEAFPYKETVDQLKAIEAVKADMEDIKPMDRLICGDVGFGKTEVAIRAAFKAVMDGRQVAIIVPTTVLAQQHYRSFNQRMADYPVDIRLLCRFVSRKEQNKTLEDMALGGCDIVIGTHRLLQKDIEFERLGLLVIDEEQRFGVEAKEQLKRMRSTVDILTMTATPIPRTLYFSLAGLRDFSTIMTPPMERKPVRTIISQEDDELIRQSIIREIERGGQVYLLHNRVQTIEKRAFQIQQLVPDARVIIGHGQMKDTQLERVMSDLIEHKCDVLVSTTIIESGLDNPRANTMIIDRADRFGLAELYQLRGRVGRYHHQAYCYLMLPKDGLIIETARARLSAIRRYTQLGAGFKLAMRELEIRGAGNLLGKQQSGHIAAIGFDMYCKLLKESVAKLERKPVTDKINVHLVLDFMPLGLKSSEVDCACIPPSFIESDLMRIEFYKKAATLFDRKKLKALEAELRDRFGIFPKELLNYFKILEIKIAAHGAGIHSIVVRENRSLMEDKEGFRRLNGKIPVLTAKSPKAKLNELLKLVKKI
ncbi:MAG: transcription-repair coupling factor, partial [Lentisphaeraceae bacterium]|nr:transcription-repair coupling factor [Lentisphaeraceae bacterium]